MKKILILFLTCFLLFPAFSDNSDLIKHNPWELMIYRPQNNGELNTVRCWIRITDMEDNDVTYTAVKATYEWVDIPDVINYYKSTYYLSGGMSMHLNIKPGKYKISVYTPPEKQNFFPCENKETWESNVFYYDTENPTKVIFVTPTSNTNGFYNGGWWIDYKAPKYVKKRALPHITE